MTVIASSAVVRLLNPEGRKQREINGWMILRILSLSLSETRGSEEIKCENAAFLRFSRGNRVRSRFDVVPRLFLLSTAL